MNRSTTLSVVAGLLLAAVLPAVAQRGPTPIPAPSPAGTRGPSDLVFSPDGKLCYVTEQDEGQVAVLDAESGKTLARIPSGGKQPTAIAISKDGGTLVVVNHFTGSVGLIDTGSRKLRAAVALRGAPRDVVIPNAGEAWVSVSQLDQVAVIDLQTGKVASRIATGRAVYDTRFIRAATVNPGRRPWSLSATPDGRQVLCANLTGGGVSRLDVAARKEVECLPLPFVNLRGITVDGEGARVYVTGQEPHNREPTARAETMWGNVLHTLNLTDGPMTNGGTTPLDEEPAEGLLTAADPGAVVAGRQGVVMIAAEGSHRVRMIGSRHKEIPVGANPRAAAARPGTSEVWVVTHLGNSLSVTDPEAGRVTRTIDLEPPTRSDIRLKGRYLFTSAHVTRGQRFTCNTCHPEGNTDGLSWQFAHLKDGIQRRNTRNIRGAVLLTPPYRWSGKEVDFEDFVQDEVQGLLRSPKMPHSDLHAYWDLVNEFPLPPNPHRAENGGFTAAAKRGRLLFVGKAGCGSCHAGAQAGGTGKKEWIGTTPPGVKVDVPHLVGVYDGAPYLHDGRAVTLEDIFRTHNAAKKHGKADLLSEGELGDLLRYVREL